MSQPGTSSDEQRLAEALARYVDSCAGGKTAERFDAAVTAEVETLAEIDRLLAPDPALPHRLSGHRILSEIGAGGMGRVFLAADEALGRNVAIKTLAPKYAANAELRERFLREARAMAQLSHPGIVRIYNLGPATEPPHFVMEFVEGAPLTQAAAKLSFAQKTELMLKVVQAVAFLHDHGILHRDLKPANILTGPDLDPKVLDFGLALDFSERRQRLSRAGEVVGTPEYLSPEQTEGSRDLDARSDIFSLGTILYELLTGSPPFAADTMPELLRLIREQDPELPRRRNPAAPAGLQNICLKALEKDPALRYRSARDMAADLQRFLVGEPVVAAPGAYSRLLAGKIEQHVCEIDGWWHDRLISDSEYHALRSRYAGLADREDAWIMEARRLTLPQVLLYLGAWLLAVGGATVAAYHYSAEWTAAVALWVALAPTAWLGIRHWTARRQRIAIAYLLGACLLLPLALVVTMGQIGLAGVFTHGRRELELFAKLGLAKATTNTQIWWALLLSSPALYGLRRLTGSPVFSLMLALTGALFCVASLLRAGMLEWLEKDPGRFYLWLLPCSAAFLATAVLLERKRRAGDSRYFYGFAAAFLYVSLTGLALFHEPWANALKSALPWTRGQIEYLFILNAGAYAALDFACGALGLPQAANLGKAFRLVIPGHVLTSLLLLGLAATGRAAKGTEATAFLWILPAAALVFVLGSIPKQMKNFLASGLLFLAVGVFRLQDHFFPGRAAWPVGVLAAGCLLMLGAAHYGRIRAFLRVPKKNRPAA